MFGSNITISKTLVARQFHNLMNGRQLADFVNKYMQIYHVDIYDYIAQVCCLSMDS